MSAQINLFQEHLRRPRGLLSGGRIVALTAWLCGIMLALSGVQAGAWYLQRHSLEELNRHHQRLIADQTRIAALLAGYKPDPALAAQLKRLEAVIKVRDPLARLLSSDWFQGQQGYSDFFVALARQHVAGTWLTGILVTGAGNDLEIEGKTVRAKSLTRYLQKLSTEPVLHGIEFKKFLLEDGDTEKDKSSAMSFSVTSSQ